MYDSFSVYAESFTWGDDMCMCAYQKMFMSLSTSMTSRVGLLWIP